jgi:hypothetical protein
MVMSRVTGVIALIVFRMFSATIDIFGRVVGLGLTLDWLHREVLRREGWNTLGEVVDLLEPSEYFLYVEAPPYIVRPG